MIEVSEAEKKKENAARMIKVNKIIGETTKCVIILN